MAQFRDSKDANLVVGAVLLIAVLVVVSVAVDTWTGKSAQVSQIEELNVCSFAFSNGNTINVVVENNGTVTTEITEVWINNEMQTFTSNSTTIHPKDHAELSITHTYTNNTSYHFKLVSERRTTYLFTATTL
jgi:hypothetical protein